MNTAPIGVFDSGLGGLTAVRALMDILPGENIVYFGDTGRVPYGSRSRETIKRYAREDIEFLKTFDCKMIIAACGTVSSVAADVLEELSVPSAGVVKPAVRAAVSATANGRIGVIGTGATINSSAYEQEIAKLDKSVKVYSRACPMFVPIVENGWNGADDEVAKIAVQRYLESIRSAGVDTLILGCTHFPLLSQVISDFMGEGVTLINTGLQAALAAKDFLSSNDLLNLSGKQGSCHFNVSDDTAQFARLGKMFLGTEIQNDVELVRL